eukprot:763163-Hanusia_phi.AAC.3
MRRWRRQALETSLSTRATQRSRWRKRPGPGVTSRRYQELDRSLEKEDGLQTCVRVCHVQPSPVA